MRASWHLVFAVVIRCVLCFSSQPSTTHELLKQAKWLIVERRDSKAAFAVLSQVYATNPNAPGLSDMLESCLQLRIDMDGNDYDRFGLASLLMDQERYEEASFHLQVIVDSDNPALVERAYSAYFRSLAAICDWESPSNKKLLSFLRLDERFSSNDFTDVPSVHPFDALRWSCISLSQATRIAQLYARRAILSQGLKYEMTTMRRSAVVISSSSYLQKPKRKVRIGYLSPDFTANHPLPFVMQHVFQHHNRQYFEVHVFSISKPQNCFELQAISKGTDFFTVLLPSQTAKDLSARIQESRIDILIDLCGYTGTPLVSEIMARRPAPLQISYMGFPGSSGAPYIDYIVCDAIVTPPSLRHEYTEGLIVMPDSYFVNSHATAVHPSVSTRKRSDYGLPEDAFVFCCHSRSDKLDSQIFDLWAGVIRELRDDHKIPAVLWLLGSCPTMEQNLRCRGQLPTDALVFCTIAARAEHLQRLGLADIFLDTPAYNAHTVGCDTLYAGVPMISLLSETQQKMASRVGASLLRAAGLDELVAKSFEQYRQLMRRCALDQMWTLGLRAKLQSRDSPLFNTAAWVGHLDTALLHLATNITDGSDVIILAD